MDMASFMETEQLSAGMEADSKEIVPSIAGLLDALTDDVSAIAAKAAIAITRNFFMICALFMGLTFAPLGGSHP